MTKFYFNYFSLSELKSKHLKDSQTEVERLKNELKLEQAKSARINEKNSKLLEEKNVKVETLKTQNKYLNASLGNFDIRYSHFCALIAN